MLRILIGFLVAALWLPLLGLLGFSWEGTFFAGAVAGAVGALTFGGLSNSLSGWGTLPGFALVGVVSALIFWVIAIRKNSSAIVRKQG